MRCPHCQATTLVYQTPLIYWCSSCGGYASLTGAPVAPIKTDPPIVTAKDFEDLDKRLKKYRKPNG